MSRKRNPPETLPWWTLPTLAAIATGGLLAAWRASVKASPMTPPPAPPPPPPAPPARPSAPPARPSAPRVVPSAALPAPALDTSGLAGVFVGMSEADYLRAVEASLLAGAVPAAQGWRPVQTQANGHTGVFYVQALPLVIGTDAEVFHAALPVAIAQRVADRLGAMLPTRRMVDLIHAQATARVPFRAYGSNHSAVSTLVASSRDIELRRAGRTGLVSDYGKDYVLTNQRRGHPGKIAIYGAWDAAGARVQGLAVPHSVGYFDYSQHARMVRRDGLVDGRSVILADALANPATAPLFSDEGPITGAMLRY